MGIRLDVRLDSNQNKLCQIKLYFQVKHWIEFKTKWNFVKLDVELNPNQTKMKLGQIGCWIEPKPKQNETWSNWMFNSTLTKTKWNLVKLDVELNTNQNKTLSDSILYWIQTKTKLFKLNIGLNSNQKSED